MLKLQPNSRQIPDIERYTADKQYCDLLYGYLQQISYKEENFRYVAKKDINFTELGKILNLNRATISKRFKNLLPPSDDNPNGLNLIEYDEKYNRYKLKCLDSSVCALVPFETLRTINNALSENCISIYVYLLKCYLANGEQEFTISIEAMKRFIGMATTTTSNNAVITDILTILAKIGLIKYEYRQTEIQKTQIFIIFVTNKLD